LRPAATEEVFCSKPDLGLWEKKTGPRKMDAEPENQQVQAHEKIAHERKEPEWQRLSEKLAARTKKIART
jgi:hypothetical protein